MRDLTIIKKFQLIMATFVLTMLAGILMDFNTSNHLKQKSQEITQAEIPVLNKAHQLKLAIVQVQQWLTDISATRGLDGLNDGFDEAENNARLFHQLIDELQRLDPENTRQYQEMVPVFNAFYEGGQKMAHAYIKQGPSGGNKMMSQFDEVAAAMTQKVDTLLEASQARADAVAVKQQEMISDQGIEHGATYLVLLLIIAAMYVIVSRSLSSLPAVIDQLKSIAAGTLSQPSLGNRSNDEIGQLCQGLDEMKQKLTQVISQVSDSTNRVADAASQTMGVADDSQNAINSQLSSVEQITEAITEMSAAIKEIASSSSDAATSARNADEEARNGKKVVEETADVIGTLLDDVTQATEVIHQLERDSESIGMVLDVIRDIADQTNLLALNAAIEAARAGDQGRGFAVVADEVRTLAQRTQDSTQEIQAMIEKLQSGAQNAVRAMEQGRTQVNRSVEQTNLAGEYLQATSRVIAEISQQSTQVASAAEQQKVFVEEMTESITHINTITIHSAEGAKTVATSSHQITELTQGLKTLVGKFRFDGIKSTA